MVDTLQLFFMLLNQVITRGGQGGGYKAPTRVIGNLLALLRHQHSHILLNCFHNEKNSTSSVIWREKKTGRINFQPIMVVGNLSELIVDQQRSEVKKEEV